MNTSITNRNSDGTLWIMSYVIGVIGLLWALVGLSEFYNVKVADEGSSYPFGPINENPWYYNDASIYATYNLTTGILFLFVSLFTMASAFKRRKRLAILSGLLLMALFFCELVSRNTQ